MSWDMYLYGGLLALAGLLLLTVPMLRYRREGGVSLILCALIIGFPLAVAGIYTQLTTVDWEQVDAPVVQQEQSAPVDGMIRELEIRLREEPDAEGYRLLGRSYASLGRYQDAADAMHEAWVLTEGQDALVTIDYAEAMILADRRSLRTSAADLLDEVLKVAPREPRALWYGGLSARARGMDDVAADRWRLLLKNELPDEMRAVVQQQLAALSVEGAPAASAEPTTVIAATIDIATDVRNLPEENDLMFLIARDMDNPMPPVAVKRVRVGEFPVTIEISDENVMIPGKRLADVQNLVVIARVSKSGNAFEKPGDVYGIGTPVIMADGAIRAAILVDTVVPE